MDEYLKLLLEQIRCTKARPYIKQELQDHMEDQIAENMKAGMDHEQAEKEAVRDMGDPVETGISLDSIHRPQAAWKLLGIIIFISIAGVLIHAGISGKASENAVAVSCYNRAGCYDDFVSAGLYRTGKIFKNNCSCFIGRLFAGYIGRRPGKRSEDFYITAGRQKRHGCTKTDAVLCPYIWGDFI